jgi:hypothetical protein
MNLGAVVGGVFMSIWGGTRPRINTMMPGIIVTGIFLALAGTAQTPTSLGITMFMFMVPIPIINAAFASMAQAKIAPDMQGRVFAAAGQITMLMSPLAYLLIGPLADKVFEPAVGLAGWSTVAPLVGDGAGAGMGLIFVGSGVLAAVTSIIVYAIPAIRHMEANLPDYEALADDSRGSLEPAPEAATT